MDDYGTEMITTGGGDPAAMDFDVLGEVIAEDEPAAGHASKFVGDGTGTKIDYSNVPPVPFQKTATLVNYFITNTAQFLNTFT